MNLTWHIVKKDLRALRWPLLIWLLIVIGQLGVGVVMLTAEGRVNADWFANWFTRMSALANVLAGLKCVSFVLVAAMIHEDMLVGTTAFWMTRPIAGARLLRAKLLGIGLVFGVLPVLVTLPWWLACGYGLREIAWAALETVMVQAICVLLGLLWAVVTDGFARFLLWILVMCFAFPSLTAMVVLHNSQTTGVMWTRNTVEIFIAVLGILVVVVQQFLTRQTWRSVAMIGVAAGLIIATGLWWPWDWEIDAKWNEFVAERVEHELPVSAEPARLAFAMATPHLAPASGGAGNLLIRIEQDFTVTGLAAGEALALSAGDYYLRWPDGTTDRGRSWNRRKDDIFLRVPLQSLGLPEQPVAIDSGQAFSTIAVIPAAVSTRLQAEPAAYAQKTLFRLMKFDSVAKVPLRPGARNVAGSYGERIAQVGWEDQNLLVTYIRSKPDFFWDPTSNQFPMSGPTESQYVLVNQAAGKSSQGNQWWFARSRIASVTLSLQLVAYGPQLPAVRRKAAQPADWTRSADLIRASFVEQTRFIHEVKLDKFPAEPPVQP